MLVSFIWPAQNPELMQQMAARKATVLAIDSTTASHYAQVRQELKLAGTPIPANDLWIAALARQHRGAVLSRDRHFDVVKGLQRVAW